MTDQTPARPGDEVTTRVVAKQYEEETEYTGFSAGRVGGCGITKSCIVTTRLYDGVTINFAEDPRDNTDAALRLLAFLRASYLKRVQLTEGGSHWLVYTKRGTAAIPISGPEFCYAVVTLAAEVLGVEGGE